MSTAHARRHRRFPPLRKRLFRAFGLVILATAAIVLGVTRSAGGDTTTLALGLGSVLALAWKVSGLLARRFARPAVELARLAGELGSGNLAARTALRACPPLADDEFVKMHRAFDDMAERLEAHVRAQKELLAAVSHELRTPLARMRLLVELARDGGAPDVNTLDELEREIVEIDALVGELLANSRLELRTLTRTRTAASSLAARALERAGLPPDRLRSSDGVALEVDAPLVLRALANLIGNALEHGGGLAALAVEHDGAVVRFVAEDRGPGLSASEPSALFEPFSQGAASGTRGTLGLGLALVRRIAEAHGGRAFAEEASPRGARIGIELPLVAEPASRT